MYTENCRKLPQSVFCTCSTRHHLCFQTATFLSRPAHSFISVFPSRRHCSLSTICRFKSGHITVHLLTSTDACRACTPNKLPSNFFSFLFTQSSILPRSRRPREAKLFPGGRVPCLPTKPFNTTRPPTVRRAVPTYLDCWWMLYLPFFLQGSARTGAPTMSGWSGCSLAASPV